MCILESVWTNPGAEYKHTHELERMQLRIQFALDILCARTVYNACRTQRGFVYSRHAHKHDILYTDTHVRMCNFSIMHATPGDPLGDMNTTYTNIVSFSPRYKISLSLTLTPYV